MGENVDGVTKIPGFESRTSPALAIVDGWLFVFGGGSGSFRNDGVLVSESQRDVARVPDAPFSPRLSFPHAVAVGDRVIVTGTPCEVIPGDTDSGEPNCKADEFEAAMLDLGSNRPRWRRIDLPASLQRGGGGDLVPLGSTSDGRAIYQRDNEVWAFKPAPSEALDEVLR